MKYEAIYMPKTDGDNPSKGGFETEKDAWDYAATFFCDACTELYQKGEGSPCDAEWWIDIEEDDNKK